jgi:hypothetical protein
MRFPVTLCPFAAAILLPVLIAGCGSPADTPEGALGLIVAQAKGGEWEQVYDAMLPELQHSQFIYLSVMHGVEHEGGTFKVEAADLYDAARRRASFVTMAAKTKGYQTNLTSIVVKSANTSGDEATLTITRQIDGEPNDESIAMRKVDGNWKLSRLMDEAEKSTADSLNQLLPPNQ